jgi:hypothetical protein
MLRTHPVIKMISFFIFPTNGTPIERNLQGKTEVLGEKPVPVPLCSPQIPHGLTRDRTRASAVRGRQLTAWAIARPAHPHLVPTLRIYVAVHLIFLYMPSWRRHRKCHILPLHQRRFLLLISLIKDTGWIQDRPTSLSNDTIRTVSTNSILVTQWARSVIKKYTNAHPKIVFLPTISHRWAPSPLFGHRLDVANSHAAVTFTS